MVNFSPLAAEICWWVWDTPANFNGFLVLAALPGTARHSTIGRQPYFSALNRGRHQYSAGRPSRWALTHISSCVKCVYIVFFDVKLCADIYLLKGCVLYSGDLFSCKLLMAVESWDWFHVGPGNSCRQIDIAEMYNNVMHNFNLLSDKLHKQDVYTLLLLLAA